MVQDLPEGVVTFLFTDVVGSTRMFEEASDLMLEALRQHDEVIEEAVAAHMGIPVRPRGEGDSRFVVFANARDAVAGAAAMQRRLAETTWVTPRPLVVRAALHTGIADLRSGDYYGSAVNRAARLRGIANGGQIIMSGSTWELVRDELPEGVTVQDLGEHGLKDLTRPERVFQVTPDGLPGEFPPLASLSSVSNNLPEQLTEFVGRQSELAEAKRLIAETRLLTLIAPGGTGKTRLAIQTAAEVSTDFHDGVFFIGFADTESSEEIIQTIAETLGVALSSDEDIQDQLLAYLAHRQQLLVLDNLEHLDGAAVIVAGILKAAPQVRVLATSRAKLNLSGETVLSLAGLGIRWKAPEKAMEAGGARLFLETARRSKPGFVIEDHELESLSEILHLVGGMPLGIILAAAWVDLVSIEEIALEIGKSADFLETEMQDVPDRHRSIRAVFNYSWNLLNPEEREIFTALSVFRGGFTRGAAEAVAGASLRSLANLVSKSLLTAHPASGRYEVHELLRQYAASELEREGDRYRLVRDAHARFYADLMGEAPFMIANGQQAQLITMIESDIENIRSAWRHHIRIGDAAGARKFMLGLFLLYEYRGWYRAGVGLLEEGEKIVPEDPGDHDTHVLRALVSAVKGWSLTMLSQPETGAQAAAQPVEFLAESGDLVDYWIAVQCRALGLAYLGSVEEMAAVLDKAIGRYSGLNEKFWAASLDDWRGFAAFLAGDLEAAARYLREAITAVEPTGEYWVTIWNLWVRAMIATQENRLEEAIALYAREVALCQEITFVRGTMVSMDGLGEANLAAGRLEAAEAAFTEGVAAAGEMGMVRDVLSMMTKVARVWILEGRPVDAAELLATVVVEPISVHQPFTDNVPIREAASAALAELEEKLGPEVFAEAYARGIERTYDTAAREMLGKVSIERAEAPGSEAG
ncbi:MAG: adenylate/guanylate cyclase domain-containing protein [Anaerolineales bacterium]|nr:adenylate/guanylate cyclase domain-containing protein [Anaerolineales bacterium]